MEDHEFDSLRNAIRTLSAEFLFVPPAEIAGLVAAEHRRYAGRPVRDYVPMLVERAVRTQLRGQELMRAS